MTDISDKKLRSIELYTSIVLQLGVSLSAVFVIIGLILFLMKINMNATSFHTYTSLRFKFPHNISTLIKSIREGQGIGFIVLGTLLLILTPISRVATSILLFVNEKDKPMSLVTLFVLIVLISSFLLGVAVK